MNRISQTVPCQYDTIFSPYRADTLSAVLDELNRKGFTGIEYAVAYPDRVDASRTLHVASLHGMTVTTLSTGQAYGLEGASFTSADSAKRRRAQEIINGHIDLSSKIGKPPVTIGLLRGTGGDGDPEALRRMFRETLLPCVEYAAAKETRLQLEPICKEETRLINTTADGLAFLCELGNPAHVGLLYDTYHSHLEDGDMAAAIHSAAGRIFNVHFPDSNRGLPGTGTIDFMPVVESLRQIEYRGAFALEAKNIPSAEYVRAHDGESIHAILNA